MALCLVGPPFMAGEGDHIDLWRVSPVYGAYFFGFSR